MNGPQYKMVNGERVEMTPEEVAAMEEMQKSISPLSPPVDYGVRANQRLDAGIAAAQPAMDELEQLARKPKPKSTDAQLASMQAQIDALQQAFEGMLLGHTGPTPRSN